MQDKEVCECGKMALWLYAPASDNHTHPFYCDDCVPRGCTCNWRYVSPKSYSPPLNEPDLPTEEDKPWKWVIQPADEYNREIKEGEVWVSIDEKGREHPCVEYWYDEEGFEKGDD